MTFLWYVHCEKKKNKPSAASDIPCLKTHETKRVIIIKALEQFMKNKESRKDDFIPFLSFCENVPLKNTGLRTRHKKARADVCGSCLSSNDLTSAAPQQVETCTREWGLSFGTPGWRFGVTLSGCVSFTCSSLSSCEQKWWCMWPLTGDKVEKPTHIVTISWKN